MKDDTEHQELLILYQVTVGELSYFKTQQWSVTTYAFLLYAAIAGVKQLVGDPHGLSEKVILTCFTIIVLIAAITVITKLQDSIEVRQARLDATRMHFGEKFNAAWNAKSKGREYIRSVWFLHAAVSFGATVVAYIIWSSIT